MDPLDPVRYISRVATETRPPDIGSLVIETLESAPRSPNTAPLNRRLRRSLDQWVELTPSGQESAVSPNETSMITDTLAFLAGEPSSAILVERPSSYTPIGRISLLSLGDQPLGAIEVGAAGGALFLRAADGPESTTGVYRRYELGRVPVLLGPLAAIARGPGPAGPAVGEAPTQPDIIK
jgi:hypothetical protein